MQIKRDEHPASSFLKSLYSSCNGGFIHILLIDRTGHAINNFVSIENIDSIPTTLKNYIGYNVYFGVATRLNGDMTKEGIIEIPCLWDEIDLTDKFGVDLPNKKEILQRLKDFSLKSTFIINSGGGLHVYWKLKKPLSKNETPFAENLLKRLALCFGGDKSSTDSSHNLRLPGTWNLKPKYKTPRKVTIEEFHPENEYSPENFDSLPQIEGTIPGEEKPPLPEGWRDEILEGVPEGQRNSSLTQLAGSYVGKRLSRNEILAILEKANSQFEPPLPFKEVESILDSILKVHQRNHPDEGAEEKRDSGHHFNLIWARDIVSTQETQREWIWEGILPAGGLSLVAAKPKVGKTTLALQAAVAVSRGDVFLGRKTRQATVVYLALEEHRDEVQKNLSKLGVTDEPLYIHFGPAPAKAMEEVEALIKEKGAKFLVIDILQKFCRVRDLNDYAQVTRTLEPLMAIARKIDCHIQMTHHAGKKERDDGDDIIGSTGLLGGVDTSIHIKKRNRESRVFFTIQRYGSDVPQTVIALKDGLLVMEGSREEVEIEETIPMILEALENGLLTEKEVGELVERNRTLVSKSLRHGVERGVIKRTGSGKKGDPFRYEKNALLLYPPIYGESNRESLGEDNLTKLQGNFSTGDFQKNESSGRAFGRAFPAQKQAEKDPSKDGLFEVMDDGQLTY